jgi:hypothetical protein
MQLLLLMMMIIIIIIIDLRNLMSLPKVDLMSAQRMDYYSFLQNVQAKAKA